MKFHPCLFTFFCQLRIRKCVTVNLICSETFSDFPQYVRNFLHCLLSDTKTLLKKRNLYYNGSPQQVNPFQNVLNPSLLFNSFVQISSESYPQKEFEGKRKGKRGKEWNESNCFGSKFYFFGGKKSEGKKAKKSFVSKFYFFHKNIQREKKKKQVTKREA